MGKSKKKTSKKRHDSRTTILTEKKKKKKIRVRLFFMLIPHIKFQDPIFNRSWPYASVTDRPSHRRTDPNQYAPSQLLRSWGHKQKICCYCCFSQCKSKYIFTHEHKKMYFYSWLPPLVKILLLVFIRLNRIRSYIEKKIKYPLFHQKLTSQSRSRLRCQTKCYCPS